MSRLSKLKSRKAARLKAYKETIERLGFRGDFLPKRWKGFTKPGSGKHY